MPILLWVRRYATSGVIATMVWLLGLPFAVLVVRAGGLDPLASRGALMPVAAGAVGGALLLAASLRWRSELLVGLTAGFVAAWCALVLVQAYNGTPYGDSGLRGDSARIAAMATRYTTSLMPHDAFVPSVPTEYPPLYPWLIARVAKFLDEPAWSLIGDAEVIVLSGAVLASFLLWKRLVNTPTALALAVLAPSVFNQGRKAYEIFILAIFLPWVLGTFARRDELSPALHWLPAGIIGGIIILTYQGYLMFAAIGIVGLAIHTWRTSADRIAYLRHLALTVLTAFIVSSWYVIPYLYGLFALADNRTSNFFVPIEIAEGAVYLDLLKPSLVSALMAIGLVGLIWYRRTRWWAMPTLWIVIAALIYRYVFVAILVASSHTGYLDYTSRLLGTVLSSAGVLTIVSAAPAVIRRLRITPSRSLAVVAVTVLLVNFGFLVWARWVPAPKGYKDVVYPADLLNYNLATFAHAEPLPDGSRTKFAPAEPTVHWFPTDPILKAIDEDWPDNARDPVVLAWDERMFVFRPMKGYMGVERLAANTFVKWDQRYAELEKLAALSPAGFTEASANTRFGPVDVFVLRSTEQGWAFKELVFDSALFDPANWTIHMLPTDTVVAIRRM